MKTVLVTGGAQGIGLATAMEFASHATCVIAGDLEENKTLKEHGIQFQKLDVSDEKSVEEAFKTIKEKHGHLDVLVNNAGINRDGLAIRYKEADWNKTLDINLKGTFLCSKYALQMMLKQRAGAIINVSSVIGLTGNAGQIAYAASKSGIIGITKSLAREAASRGVRINAVAPGFVETRMTEALKEDIQEEIKSRIPLARFAAPEEIASVIYFLASDQASYITGETINISGGLYI